MRNWWNDYDRQLVTVRECGSDGLKKDSVILFADSREQGISSYATLVVHVACHVHVAIHTPVFTPTIENDCMMLMLVCGVYSVESLYSKLHKKRHVDKWDTFCHPN